MRHSNLIASKPTFVEAQRLGGGYGMPTSDWTDGAPDDEIKVVVLR